MYDLIKGWLYLLIGGAILVFLVYMTSYLQMAKDLDDISQPVVTTTHTTPQEQREDPLPEEPADTTSVSPTEAPSQPVVMPENKAPNPNVPPLENEEPPKENVATPEEEAVVTESESTQNIIPEKVEAPPESTTPEAVPAWCSLFQDQPLSETLAQASDILEWQGVEGQNVYAPVAGTVVKLNLDPHRGRVLYLLDSSGQWCFLIGRLNAYGEGIAEGKKLACGEILGQTGASLHLSVLKTTPGQNWWKGQPTPLTTLSGDVQ